MVPWGQSESSKGNNKDNPISLSCFLFCPVSLVSKFEKKTGLKGPYKARRPKGEWKRKPSSSASKPSFCKPAIEPNLIGGFEDHRNLLFFFRKFLWEKGSADSIETGRDLEASILAIDQSGKFGLIQGSHCSASC